MSDKELACEENFKVEYEEFGRNVYKEYEELNKLLCSKLDSSHLDPFAKILLDHENVVLYNQNELMETARNNLEKQIQNAFKSLWQINSVSEALVSLEMLKETFKPHEGHNWNLDTKTPWELTRPMRMRFKENRLRYLQAQLDFQTKQLNEVLQETEELRQHFRDVKIQRDFLMSNTDDNRTKVKEAKSKIIDLHQKMLLNNREDINTEIKNIQ